MSEGISPPLSTDEVERLRRERTTTARERINNAIEESTEMTLTESAAPQPQEAGTIEVVGPRRVDLVRGRDGQYSIWMGDRCIEHFCSEWETITGHIIHGEARQQVRINIEPVGGVHPLAARHRGEPEPAIAVAQDQDTEEIRAEEAAPPRAMSYMDMFGELPGHARDDISRHVYDLYHEFTGARTELGRALDTMAEDSMQPVAPVEQVRAHHNARLGDPDRPLRPQHQIDNALYNVEQRLNALTRAVELSFEATDKIERLEERVERFVEGDERAIR